MYSDTLPLILRDRVEPSEDRARGPFKESNISRTRRKQDEKNDLVLPTWNILKTRLFQLKGSTLKVVRTDSIRPIKRVRKVSLSNECIKEKTPISSFSTSPVKNKKMRAGQRIQHHRGHLLFSKVRTTIILNLPFTYNGIFPSEYTKTNRK